MPDIVLAAVNAKFIHASFGLRYLFANLGPLQSAACMMEFDINQRAVDIAEALVKANPRIIGLGVYIWNVEQVGELMGILRRVIPGVVIVLGGPEVSFEVSSQPAAGMADYVITGEGDTAFADLCSGILTGSRPKNRIIAAAQPELQQLATPYSCYTDHDLAHRVVYVETSRGCPFRCEFCLSSLDTSVRFFSLPHLLEELQKLLDRGAQQLKFVDRTFNANERQAAAILDFFLERMRPGLFLHFELVPDRLANAIKERLRRFPPGAVQLEIGIQTFNSEVADRIQRRQDNHKIEENIRFLREETGVHLHTDLIFGLPGETWDSFAAGFDRLALLNPHEIQVGMLKRLRGVPIVRHDDEFQMRYNPKAPYEILRNRDIEFDQMQELRRFARTWDLTANSGNFIETTPLLWRSSHSPFQSAMAWSQWLHARAGTLQGVALTRLAEFVFNFLVESEKLEPAVVAPVLYRDYQRGGRNDMPPFLRPHLDAEGLVAGRLPLSNNAKRQARHAAGAALGGRLHIRDASAADASAIARLFADHLAALGYVPDPELDEDMAGLPGTYASEGGHFIVAEDESGALAGMAGLKGGEIRRLYIIPAYRRQGLACRLVQTLIDRHQGRRTLFAVIAPANKGARAVFASSGFISTGAAPDHPRMRHCEIMEYKAKKI